MKTGVDDAFRPRFVGDDFSDFVHPSLFGAFSMAVRLNCFLPKDYLTAFDLRVRRADDLSRVLTFSDTRKRSVQTALGLDASIGALEPWLPFSCDIRIFESVWSFRYCPSCLRIGYHTMLHQLPWIHRCPWHGDRLRDNCRRCSRHMEVSGTSGRRLLQCACGFDALNELAAVAGDPSLPSRSGPFLEQYLTWAAERRKNWHLFPPQGVATDVSVLTEIVRLPPGLATRCQDGHQLGKHHTGRLVERSPPFGIDDLQSAITKIEAIQEDGSGVIEVPVQLEHAIMRVACDLANRLPEKTLSDAEMTLFFDGSERQPDGRFQPAVRKSIQDIAWLPSRLVGDRRFLSLRCIDPKASRVAGDLLAFLARGVPAGNGAAEAARWFALQAVARTLLRGYAEGMRTVIAGHSPALFDTRRDRPHRTEPWAILDVSPDNRRVHWVWARAPTLLD